IYMDVGHLSQTFYLVSNWMNLGAFFVGALRDEVVENFLGINPYQEIVIGASGIGPIKQNDIEKGRFVRDDVDYWEKRGEQTWRVLIFPLSMNFYLVTDILSFLLFMITDIFVHLLYI